MSHDQFVQISNIYQQTGVSTLQGWKQNKKSTNPHLSNEENLGWLGYIGDYTTQLYGDYNKPL